MSSPQEAPEGARRSSSTQAAGATYQSIPIRLIAVPEDRLSAVRAERVETIGKTAAAVGQLQPIIVEALPAGGYRLIAGAKRLTALDLAGHDTIQAKVHPAGSLTEDRRRLIEIVENIDRTVMPKLEFAEHLAELKVIHERLHPETRRGIAGARARHKKKAASEIFSFAGDAAEKTGLSRRAIEIAVAIAKGLTDAAKARIRGTWLEDHQAGLRQLAEQPAALQGRVLDLLFSDPPQADSVADALLLAQGKRLASRAEKLWAATLGNWSRLTARQRGEFLDANEQAIRQHAKQRGWF
jgi:ParB family chromosome partitioning protein